MNSSDAGIHGLLNFSCARTASLSATPSMSITSMGNVGIGTTNPTAPLHIYRSEESTEIQNLLKLQHGTERPIFNFQSTNNDYDWYYNTGFLGHGMSLSTAGGKKITCQTDSSSI